MFVVTTYASNENTSWTTFPRALAKSSTLHGNSIFRHIHLPLHPRLQLQCLRMLKAFATSGKVIHMISNFFDQPQFSIGGNICIGCIALDHT